MSSTDETKPATKSGGPSRKGEARRQKSNPTESPAPVQMQTTELEQEPVPQAGMQAAAIEPLEAADAEAAVAEAMIAEAIVTETGDTPADVSSPAEPAAVAEPSPVSLQTLANAYRDYARKSFEEFRAFFEQLIGVRSLDKALEVQTEFVKRAYENSVAESQKLRELHRKLVRQTLQPFGGLTAKTPGKS